MSSSPLSSTSPANAPDSPTISSAIRRVVRDGVKNGEEMTVRIARTRAEAELGLDAGFLKDDAEWKERGKTIIQAAFEEPESPVKAEETKGRKRKSEYDAAGSKKKPKKAPAKKEDEDEDEDEGFVEEQKPKPKPKARSRKAPAKKPVEVSDKDELDEIEEEKPRPKPRPRARKPAARKVEDSDNESIAEQSPALDTITTSKPDDPDSSALSEVPEESVEPVPTKQAAPTTAAAEDDGSDISSLIDEPARPTKKPRASSKTCKPKATAKSKPAARSKPTADLPPEEAEIKRLQSQLLACGIRKLWHRELAPYSTPSKKISHLKDMLSEAGMTGRYSLDKARAIKEARELKAELESAREFEAKWGQGKDEDGDDGEGSGEDVEKVKEKKRSAGGRVLPKGLVDFGDSGDDGSD